MNFCKLLSFEANIYHSQVKIEASIKKKLDSWVWKSSMKSKNGTLTFEIKRGCFGSGSQHFVYFRVIVLSIEINFRLNFALFCLVP